MYFWHARYSNKLIVLYCIVLIVYAHAVYTHLDSLPRTVLTKIERRLYVIGVCDQAHSDLSAVDVHTVDKLRDEVEHVPEVWSVDAAGRIQHEHDVRSVHALCSHIFIYLFIMDARSA